MDHLRIPSAAPYPEPYHPPNAQAANAQAAAAPQPSSAADRDAFDSHTAPAAPQSADEVAQALRRQFQQVTFIFDTLPDGQLADFAAAAGPGIHLIIDPEMLDWMAQDATAWQDGMTRIQQTIYELLRDRQPGQYNSGAVLTADGQTTLWTATCTTPNDTPKREWIQEAETIQAMLKRFQEQEKQAAARRKQFQLTQKKKINYQVGRDMARLAKGVTARDVRSLISRVYASRGRIATSSSYDKQEIQRTLAQMDHVIRCARTKIRQLKEEDQLALREKKAEQHREEQLRRALEQELKVRRQKRMAKEHARVAAHPPDLPGLRDVQEQRDAREQAMAAAQAAGLHPTLTGMPSGAPVVSGAPAAGVPDVGTAPAGETVQVTINTIG